MEQPNLGAFAGSFTQIPLDANKLLIPYTDLGATSGYGRALVLPDDIIPGLQLLSLVGASDGAHLWTGKHQNGVADVYVVNESSGGGGLAASQKIGSSGRVGTVTTVSGTSTFGPFPSLAASKGLYAMDIDVTVNPAAAPAASSPWSVGIQDGSGAPTIVLASGVFWLADYSAPLGRVHIPLTFVPYLDWAGSGLNNVGLKGWVTNGSGGVSVQLNAVVTLA